jgi:hypothetical protein
LKNQSGNFAEQIFDLKGIFSFGKQKEGKGAMSG